MASGGSLPAISVASITIGFISFAFTLAIWLHSFWDWFQTLSDAPTQVQDHLSTLRQGLYEERAHLKRIRGRGIAGTRSGRARGSGGQDIYADGGPLKVINDAVKHLIRDFKALERPFLIAPHEGREKDLEWSFDATQRYYRCDLVHRIIWLQSKHSVKGISARLNALQIRRIAVEVSDSKL